MKNNTFQQLADVLREKERILIFPHINMDGDALGSAAALCKALRQMGKSCHILIEDPVPSNLRFLDKGYTTFDQTILKNPDLSLCVDCGDPGRFPKRQDVFLSAEHTMCIDHHGTTKAFCDYQLVDADRAATGLLIYHLLCALDISLDKEMGEALFAAITTDTGNFQYSNTSKECHQVMAELYDAGIDANGVSVELYENMRVEKLRIRSKALETMDLFCHGKGVIAYVTQEMLKETGATHDETEGVAQDLRSISTVEVAAFLKEMEDGTIKASFRAKHRADVAAIASAFGGGGHVKAAGCTLHHSMQDAIELLKEKMTESLETL